MDVPPIVSVSDDCYAINQPFNVIETNLNVEDDVTTSYFPPSKKPNAFLLLIMITIQYHSIIHPHPAQQTVHCLTMMYSLGTLSLLPIMQQILMRSSLIIMDRR
jgi:hypothetical protein